MKKEFTIFFASKLPSLWLLLLQEDQPKQVPAQISLNVQSAPSISPDLFSSNPVQFVMLSSDHCHLPVRKSLNQAKVKIYAWTLKDLTLVLNSCC